MNRTEPREVRRGFEQFRVTRETAGVSLYVSGSQPYVLDAVNETDRICLVLGTLGTTTRHDDEAAQSLVYHAETAAFHPRGTRIVVEADKVQDGFIAFGYSPEFQSSIDERNVVAIRDGGSRENIGGDGLRHLVRYARTRVMSSEGASACEIECLATLAYIETLKGLRRAQDERRTKLSNEEFGRVESYIVENLENGIKCAEIASSIGLPLRVVFDGIKSRTGQSLYRFVIEKRVEAALHLLRTTDEPISEIALSCGFSSQQHMTSLFTQRLNATPMELRRRGVQA